MSLLYVIIILIAIGVILGAINTYVPMARPIKSIINLIVIIAVVVWLLQVFGVWSHLNLNLHMK